MTPVSLIRSCTLITPVQSPPTVHLEMEHKPEGLSLKITKRVIPLWPDGSYCVPDTNRIPQFSHLGRQSFHLESR